MYKLCFYVPESHLEPVKSALFEAGAGKIGDYECCCWQVKGEGQFKPLEGSQPFIGRQGQIEQVDEYRVEMVCEQRIASDVIRALKRTHPYEEPAFDLIEVITRI